jgi:CRISPR-associated protein Csm2
MAKKHGGKDHDENDPAFKRNFKQEFDSSWITEQISKDGIKFADDFGKVVAKKGLTTSQIRNFFGEVKRIQLKGYENEQTAFLLLKPKLAYAAKRARGNATDKFKEVMDQAHDAVEEGNNGHFINFVNFLEAILAYHKAYGGKD